MNTSSSPQFFVKPEDAVKNRARIASERAALYVKTIKRQCGPQWVASPELASALRVVFQNVVACLGQRAPLQEHLAETRRLVGDDIFAAHTVVRAFWESHIIPNPGSFFDAYGGVPPFTSAEAKKVLSLRGAFTLNVSQKTALEDRIEVTVH